jgi:hemolysin III
MLAKLIGAFLSGYVVSKVDRVLEKTRGVGPHPANLTADEGRLVAGNDGCCYSPAMYPGERLNSITHLVGAVLALAGTAALIVAAWPHHGAREIAAFAVYGTMLVLLYLSSTLYHSIRGPAKKVFHRFDYCAIYFLIAGTYTPFTLLTLRGKLGWTLFGVIWTLAAVGIVKDVFFHGHFRIASATLKAVMGWLIVVAIVPLSQALPSQGMTWLAVGGVFYTVGIIFFAWGKYRAVMHTVWHFFVIGGSICHYVAILRYVALPIGAA